MHINTHGAHCFYIMEFASNIDSPASIIAPVPVTHSLNFLYLLTRIVSGKAHHVQCSRKRVQQLKKT